MTLLVGMFGAAHRQARIPSCAVEGRKLYRVLVLYAFAELSVKHLNGDGLHLRSVRLIVPTRDEDLRHLLWWND